MTMKLFAVYVGGDMEGANIELHDMRFAIAERIEDTYGQLRAQWWGKPDTLHIDCWTELTRADGYAITLRPQPSPDTQKLFYVNLGGYDPLIFTELHQNSFVVAESESKAKIRALKTVRHWQSFHKDEIYEAEKSFCISDGLGMAWCIHLEKIEDPSPAPFVCGYKKI